MKRLLPFVLLALASPVTAQRPPRGGHAPMLTPAGNPSALIAAEIAFARLAREKGQWTAFDATAADTAEMFLPQRTLARPWLKKRANPAQPLQWQPHAAWVSCDGSAGVTYGAFQSTGTGWFSTVWQRQKNGDYKWILDQGGDLAAPLTAPDWIEGKVADCPARSHQDDDATPPQPVHKPDRNAPPPVRPLAGPIPALAAPAGSDSKDGQSNDGSLAWRSTVLPGGSHVWTVWMWKDGAMAQVLTKTDIAKNEG